ncbi:MAG: hypothetical protein ABSB55_01405 [Acidimicrobiales bacterium]
MAKQLIRDALASVIDRQRGAHAMLQRHFERRLRGLPNTGLDLLTEVLVDKDPRSRLLARLVDDLTSGSLQSADEVLRVASYFDIPSAQLVEDVPLLQAIFDARNQIVHEMDVDFGRTNRSRRSRTRALISQYTDELFKICSTLLREVDARA